MREFLPEQKQKREEILSKIRLLYESYGFTEIETSIIESDLLLNSNTGDNQKMRFRILRRGLKNEDLQTAIENNSTAKLADEGLRYDLTLPLARFYANNRSKLPSIFKALQIGSVFRAERPQKGRYRQFVQTDIDIFGEPTIEAEIEILSSGISVLQQIGIPDFTIQLNSRKILNRLLDYCEVRKEFQADVMIILDKADKNGGIDWATKELLNSGFISSPYVAPMSEALKYLDSSNITGITPEWLDESEYENLLIIKNTLITLYPNVPININLSLIRGMGYYTGIIYEVTSSEVGYSIAGGGRYDSMLNKFLEFPTPAVGFSIGFERIIDLITNFNEQNGLVILYKEGQLLQAIYEQKTLLTKYKRVLLQKQSKNLKSVLTQNMKYGYKYLKFVGKNIKQLE